MRMYRAKTLRAIEAVRGGAFPKDAAKAHGVILPYLYQVLRAEGVALPTKMRRTIERPSRLKPGDRVRLHDGRQGTVCARVAPRDAVAYVLPDDGSRVFTVAANRNGA